MEAAGSSEKLVPLYRSTQLLIPENHTLNVTAVRNPNLVEQLICKYIVKNIIKFILLY
jgi:hypothetical protein